jgi:16S rRNA (cytosine1402-N4)-methyltransferase
MNHSANIPDGQHTSTPDADYHVPVMLEECIAALEIKTDGIYVDCTFGGGGHSRGILKKLGPDGKLIVFDQDAAVKINLPDDGRLVFVQQNFRHLKKFLRVNKVLAVNGILADLGVSSHQFDEPERGFSTRFESKLDMRMDPRQQLTAAHILNTYDAAALHKLFERYGEVTNAKTLANRIVTIRKTNPIETVSQFRQAVYGEVKGNPHKYFAQVFQALRIEVNNEIGALKEMLAQVAEVLKPGGRVAIISFHSLEDRIVKHFFRHGGVEEDKDDLFGNKPETELIIINKKPIVASAEEMKQNSRSRSAKLRIAAKKIF